jgi:hypothetical protein
MKIELMVDPKDEQTVAETMHAVDPTLLAAKPEHRAHLDGQQLVSFALHVASNLDPISVAIGAFIAKHIAVRVEVGGVPLNASTFKEGLILVRRLRELFGGQKKPKKQNKQKKSKKRR